jgi:hypothetical protein
LDLSIVEFTTNEAHLSIVAFTTNETLSDVSVKNVVEFERAPGLGKKSVKSKQVCVALTQPIAVLSTCFYFHLFLSVLDLAFLNIKRIPGSSCINCTTASKLSLAPNLNAGLLAHASYRRFGDVCLEEERGREIVISHCISHQVSLYPACHVLHQLTVQ